MKKRTLLAAALAVLLLFSLCPAALAMGYDLSSFDWLNPSSSAFSLKDYLRKDEETNTVRVLPPYLHALGKEAILHGHTIERRDGLSLTAIRLETGRGHQIRVQMQHFGFPLWGDQRYGNGKPGQQIALWGMRLTLAHPVTGARMVFVAPAPKDGIWTRFSTALDTAVNLWPAIREGNP